MSEVKICTGCQTEKALDQFGRQASGKGGHRAWCWDCARADSRRHYAANREERIAKTIARRKADPEAHRAARKAQKLRRNYGLTVEARDLMADAQGNRCAICRQDRPLKVDHCHKSGRVRALLCGPCNTSLGAFKDDPGLLERAAACLREHRS